MRDKSTNYLISSFACGEFAADFPPSYLGSRDALRRALQDERGALYFAFVELADDTHLGIGKGVAFAKCVTNSLLLLNLLNITRKCFNRINVF